jgi:oligopeptide transport system permease protein
MWLFLLRRLVVAVPTLFLVVTAAFFMMRAAPGSPFDMDRKLSPEIERNVKAKYGLDKPILVQYGAYLGDVVRATSGPR